MSRRKINLFCSTVEYALYVKAGESIEVDFVWCGDLASEDVQKHHIDNQNANLFVCHMLSGKTIDNKLKELKDGTEYYYILNVFEVIFVSGPKKKGHGFCPECLLTRWINNRKDRKFLLNIARESISINNFSMMAPELIKTILTLSFGSGTANDEVFKINKNLFTVAKHKILAYPTCPYCTNLERDDLVKTDVYFRDSLGKNQYNGKRKYNLSMLEKYINKKFVDQTVGIVNFVLDDIEAPYAVAVANLPILKGKDEVGVGRTSNYADSRAVALLEALERYCGIEPRGKTTRYYYAYDEIRDKAIPIEKMGLHNDEQYSMKGFPFKPFDQREKRLWVSGYNLTCNKQVLVPEAIAYYGTNLRDGKQNSFVYEISNGCAIGGDMYEAIASGIMEVIERDAFLITWYNKISIPEIDLVKLNCHEILLMIEKFEYNFPYKLRVFYMTLDISIPIVLSVVEHINEKKDEMQIMCAAGCSFTLENAIINSIHELCDILPALSKKFHERIGDIRQMALDYSKVKTMEDHCLLYGLLEMKESFNFLLRAIPNPMVPACSTQKSNLLNYLVEELSEKGLDVIAVDQTSQELRDDDVLFCVKVLVPGMVPMTFGHDMIRASGLPRLIEVPRSLGYVSILDKNNRKDCLLEPHPFP